MSDNQIDNEVKYDLAFLMNPKWIIFSFSFFILVALYNFPLSKKIDQIVYSSLAVSNSCKIQISDYGINVFPLPHLSIKNLNVPATCFGRGKDSIFLPELRAYFRGPSFSPLGVLFKVESEFKSVPIELFFTAGISNFVVVMKESTIPLEILRDFLPGVKLAGHVKTDFYFEISKMKLKKINLNIQSKTFVIPAQNIEGYKIETLNIQDMQLIAATDEKSNLKISKFILGNEQSPVRSSFKGSINISPNNLMSSSIDLQGELALSKELSDSLGFLFTQFDKKDNFYQIHLSGLLAAPKMSSKR